MSKYVANELHIFAYGTWHTNTLTLCLPHVLPAFVAFIFIFLCDNLYESILNTFFVFILAFGCRVFGSTQKEVHRMRNLSFLDKILFFAFTFFFFFVLRSSLRRSLKRYVFYFYLRRVCVCVCGKIIGTENFGYPSLFIFYAWNEHTHIISSREGANGIEKKLVIHETGYNNIIQMHASRSCMSCHVCCRVWNRARVARACALDRATDPLSTNIISFLRYAHFDVTFRSLRRSHGVYLCAMCMR